MKIIIAILAAIMVVGVVGGCVINVKEDDMETKNYDIKDFNRVEVGSAFEVQIEQGDTFQVKVTADDLSYIRVEKSGDTLIIKRHGFEGWAPFHRQPKAIVTLPVLNSVTLSGASHGTINDFHSDTDLSVNVSGASHLQAANISAGRLDVTVSGASTLKGDIKAQNNVQIDVTGASKLELAGKGADAEIAVNGASSAELSDFPMQDASLKVSGASKATVNLDGKLDADVTGASHLYWSGTPTMGNIRTSGASSLGNK